jgi:hypothetical protein
MSAKCQDRTFGQNSFRPVSAGASMTTTHVAIEECRVFCSPSYCRDNVTTSGTCEVLRGASQGVCGQGRTGTTSTEFAGEPLMILELTAT